MFKITLTDLTGKVKTDKEVSIVAVVKLQEDDNDKAYISYDCDATVNECIDFAAAYFRSMKALHDNILRIAKIERNMAAEKSTIGKLINDLRQRGK